MLRNRFRIKTAPSFIHLLFQAQIHVFIPDSFISSPLPKQHKGGGEWKLQVVHMFESFFSHFSLLQHEVSTGCSFLPGISISSSIRSKTACGIDICSGTIFRLLLFTGLFLTVGLWGFWFCIVLVWFCSVFFSLLSGIFCTFLKGYC